MAQNVYTLDTSRMTQVQGTDGQPFPLTLKPGDTVQLPNGLGSVEFAGIERFASFDVRYTPGQTAALVFALLATTGLVLSLFLPRRRVWVKASAAAVEPGPSCRSAGWPAGTTRAWPRRSRASCAACASPWASRSPTRSRPASRWFATTPRGGGP